MLHPLADALLVEYCPTPHAVHALAPERFPVFVIEPAAHSVHDATFDAAEYCPATHFVHLTEPAPAPVSVIEPA